MSFLPWHIMNPFVTLPMGEPGGWRKLFQICK
jgi:hypothetical protein